VYIDAPPGEFLGIVGESGSGKSTVLRPLNLEEPGDGGSYHLDIDGLESQNLFELSRFARREVQVQHIGIVYQNPPLGSWMDYSSSGNVPKRTEFTPEITPAGDDPSPCPLVYCVHNTLREQDRTR
jgi:putative phosphonate transport system ATP-binding protein